MAPFSHKTALMKRGIHIFLVEDDDEDAFLIQEAVSQISASAHLHRLKDGVALMERLHGRAPKENGTNRPDFILLDVAMPRKDGKQALVEIKNHPDLKHIPVVMLSTSAAPEDVKFCYQEGANSFVQKPKTWESMLQLISCMCAWWGQSVLLP